MKFALLISLFTGLALSSQFKKVPKPQTGEYKVGSISGSYQYLTEGDTGLPYSTRLEEAQEDAFRRAKFLNNRFGMSVPMPEQELPSQDSFICDDIQGLDISQDQTVSVPNAWPVDSRITKILDTMTVPEKWNEFDLPSCSSRIVVFSLFTQSLENIITRFSKFGYITEAFIVHEEKVGRPSFAFLTFEEHISAVAAVSESRNYDIARIGVDYAEYGFQRRRYTLCIVFDHYMPCLEMEFLEKFGYVVQRAVTNGRVYVTFDDARAAHEAEAYFVEKNYEVFR